jgi:hypothetical protein
MLAVEYDERHKPPCAQHDHDVSRNESVERSTCKLNIARVVVP